MAEFEPSQRSPQQGNRSFGISGIEVVECRRCLNQRLQKTLLRLFQFQPNALPMLVGKEELRISITGKALCERTG